MLSPQILPDEFVLGYRARVRILNGFTTNDSMMRALLPNAQWSIASQTGTPPVVALANISGTDCIEFVCRHSMIPFVRAIVRRDPKQGHGDPKGGARLMRSGVRELRGAAYFCPDCAKEDMDFWGIPYWRRSHQIPGIDWCLKHGHRLQCTDKESFDQLPPGLEFNIADCSRSEEADHPVIRRYGEIIEGLMDRKTPIFCTDVGRILGKAAQLYGLRISPRGRRQLPSDLAKEKVPSAWLSRHFPHVASKPSFEYVSNFDAVCEGKSACFTTEAYVLAAALLFSSADEALFALTHPESSMPFKPLDSRSKLLPNDRRSRQLMAAYIHSNGKHHLVARILNAEEKNITKLLYESGLPALGNVDVEMRTALVQVLQGMPWDQVCYDGGPDSAALMEILRSACHPLLFALQAMEALGKKSKPSVH